MPFRQQASTRSHRPGGGTRCITAGDTAPHPGGAVAEEWSIGDVSVPPHVQERIELLRRIVRTAKSISKWMAMVVLSQGVWALGWQYRVLSVYWIGILWNIVSEAFSLQALLQFLESSARSCERRILREQHQWRAIERVQSSVWASRAQNSICGALQRTTSICPAALTTCAVTETGELSRHI